jgi:hypothetical protein
MAHTEIRFDVHGKTLGELQDRAYETLEELVRVNAVEWTVRLHVEPEVHTGEEIQLWRGEVTATNPSTYRP